MAEHLLCKERVRSSSLLVSTTPEGRGGKNAGQEHLREQKLNIGAQSPKRAQVLCKRRLGQIESSFCVCSTTVPLIRER